jgi:hypothetical protein
LTRIYTNGIRNDSRQCADEKKGFTMKLKHLWLTSLLVVVAAAIGAAQSQPPSDLVVHEWGTFLAMQGSDGVTLDGMYHEEHALPAFVHARSHDQLRLPSVDLKGETPVIYFYTQRKQNVWVKVDFPRGVWTQWYPQAGHVGPQFSASGSLLQPRGGHISWSVEVLPNSTPALPQTAKDALWNFARDVDAASVKAGSEAERFIFYRGLGRAPLPLQMTMNDGRLESSQHLRHLFILRVENGKGVYRYLPELKSGESITGVIPRMTDALPMDEFTRKVVRDLATRLVESGLYPKEARAMVNTWRTSYFHTDGVRVLFVLPQTWTDEFIPMEVSPQPKQIVRVMVGRLEVLTPERERLAENAVRDLAASDSATRERAFNFLREQGRYVEPIVRRVLRTSKDEKVQTLCKRLLLTDFVTELRSAVNAPTNGARLHDDPLHVRAQLASLLREIGLDTEAKKEAQAILPDVQKIKAPGIGNHTSRLYLRTYARAMEGVGNDEGAAEWYGKFIRFGSQTVSRQCNGCHQYEGPRDAAWFRDWWVGRKFAQYETRIKGVDKAIAEREASLAKNPNDVAAQMMLAYLYEAKGEMDRAGKMWAKLETPATKTERVATSAK